VLVFFFVFCVSHLLFLFPSWASDSICSVLRKTLLHGAMPNFGMRD